MALALAVLAAAACGAPEPDQTAGSAPSGEHPTIVATTAILGDVTRHVIGDLAEVEVLMPAGTDPHEFEPSARQAAQLRDADLVVANGLGLEAGLADALAAVRDEGVAVLEVGPQLSPEPLVAEGGDGAVDPHVWMDPDRMAAAALLIASQVAEVTGLDATALTARAEAFGEQIRAADEQIQAVLAPVPDERRVLVTDHDSLGYFARRYGFEVVGTVIPGGSTQAEPSASQIAELADVIRRRQVPAIFTEAGHARDLADTLAAEVGRDVEVVVLFTGSLGPPDSGADTYLGMLVTDAERIAAALAP